MIHLPDIGFTPPYYRGNADPSQRLQIRYRMGSKQYSVFVDAARMYEARLQLTSSIDKLDELDRRLERLGPPEVLADAESDTPSRLGKSDDPERNTQPSHAQRVEVIRLQMERDKLRATIENAESEGVERLTDEGSLDVATDMLAPVVTGYVLRGQTHTLPTAHADAVEVWGSIPPQALLQIIAGIAANAYDPEELGKSYRQPAGS